MNKAITNVSTLLSLLCVNLAAKGCLFAWLWEWFLVPFGLPSISIVHGIGLLVVVTSTKKLNFDPKTQESVTWAKSGYSIAMICALFFVGYLVSLGM